MNVWCAWLTLLPLDCSFVLANAQIVDYPIVYCNDGFSKMIGYTRAEIMQKPCSLSFMYGENTDHIVIQKLQGAFENAQPIQAELCLNKKNSKCLAHQDGSIISRVPNLVIGKHRPN